MEVSLVSTFSSCYLFPTSSLSEISEYSPRSQKKAKQVAAVRPPPALQRWTDRGGACTGPGFGAVRAPLLGQLPSSRSAASISTFPQSISVSERTGIKPGRKHVPLQALKIPKVLLPPREANTRMSNPRAALPGSLRHRKGTRGTGRALAAQASLCF